MATACYLVMLYCIRSAQSQATHFDKLDDHTLPYTLQNSSEAFFSHTTESARLGENQGDDKTSNASRHSHQSTQDSSVKGSRRTRKSPYDNGVMTKSMYLEADNVIKIMLINIGIITLLVCVCSAAVFWTLRHHSPVNKFLFAINAADSMSGTIILTNTMLRRFAGTSYSLRKSNVYLGLCSLYVSVSSRRFLYVLYCYICLQSLLAVAFPVRRFHCRLSSRPWLKIVIMLCIMFSFQTYLLCKFKVDFDKGHYILNKTKAYLDHSDLFDGLASTSRVVFSYVPVTLSLIMNILLMASIKVSKRRRRWLQEGFGHCGDQKSGRHIYVIAVSSAFFVLLSLPNNILQAVSNFHPTLGLNKPDYYLYKTLDQAFFFGQDLSRVTSFLTYVILCEDFRRKCIRIFCPWRKRRRPSASFDRTVEKKNSGSVSESEDCACSQPSVPAAFSVTRVAEKKSMERSRKDESDGLSEF